MNRSTSGKVNENKLNCGAGRTDDVKQPNDYSSDTAFRKLLQGKSRSTHKRKLLIYAHYYAPDVASTGQILKELAEGMLDTFDITVICVVPSYDGSVQDKYKTQKYYHENRNGVGVLRIRVPDFTRTDKMSRVKNILGYFFGAVIATFQTGPQDYVFAISQPPILGGLLGVWGKWIKKARYIYNIQDFNPEQTMAVGYSRSKPVLNAMMWFDKFSCRRSDLIVTVGRDLVQTLRRRFEGKKVPEHVMINNWIDEKEIYPLDQHHPSVLSFRKQYGLDGKFVFMYSGNLGLYYDLENLITVVEKFQGDMTADGQEVIFAFVGGGAVLGKLEAYAASHQLKHVVFIPYQDKKDVIYSLNAADVHWCVNARGIKGVSCPSKYYGIAACGKPVLAVLEKGSEIRMIIEETGSGLVSEPGDYDRTAENIKWFIENAGSRRMEQMGKNGYGYLRDHFTREASVNKYRDAILGKLVSGGDVCCSFISAGRL